MDAVSAGAVSAGAASASDSHFSFGSLSEMRTRDDIIADAIQGVDSSFILVGDMKVGDDEVVAYCKRCSCCFRSHVDVNYHIYHHHMPSNELRRSYGHTQPIRIEPFTDLWKVLNGMHPFASSVFTANSDM